MIAQNFGHWNPTRTWRTASNVDKVRLYTRQSFFAICLFFGGFGVFTEVMADQYLVAVFLGISAVAAVVTIARIPDLGGVVTEPVRIPLAVMTVAALAATGIAVVHGDSGPYFWLAAVVAVPFAALVELRFLILGATAIAVGFVIAGRADIGAFVASAVAFMTVTVLMSVWLLRMVTELDEARGAAAALSVAEERLRFSRDLHDVVGRALSAIAVKSDLAATLSRRGDDRAAQQMDEVRDLAQESLVEARELVRGYRSIALASELAGARSLLEAAGISTDIHGSADALPIEFAETAAWVVREGVTNILRHSSAQTAVIEVTDASVSIVNDGVGQQQVSDGTGLNGLRERVEAVGGTLEVTRDDERFTLTTHFSHPTKESR
ncbi:histidine kinase [Rhodococcus sp. IEGM 1379]|uniref:sensor histidine kinase n=1 Tax=Rhodococcus sp. IEGM 1379 TaxID=3047086 RepID=UPI0024B7A153|nr:histidine kinase [Rhodococcus sp. IEGM 1379]MDI9915944.1 histidine kinase [Rhodococcus sp. IEGM 1379]